MLLASLDVNKATGVDGTSAKLLGMVVPAVAGSLTSLFNASLRSGQLPSEWKRANVIPVQKSEENNCISNF